MIQQLTVAFLILSQLPAPLPQTFESPLTGLTVVNHYMAPLTEYSTGHRGIDIKGNLNALVAAPTDAILIYSGKVGYRNLINLAFQDKKLTIEPVCSNLQEGTTVSKGEVIGTLCEADPEYSWHCPYCLHLGIRNQNGYLSPELFLGGLPPSRLVP